MAKRGPKAQLAVVRKVRGSRQPLAPVPPVGPQAAEEPPVWLPPRAQQLWQEMTGSGMRAFHSVMERYCISRARWEAGVQLLYTQGSVLLTESGYHYAHPLVRELHELADEIDQLEGQMIRLTPEKLSKTRFFSS